VQAAAVGASLIAFVVVYFLVFGAGVFYMLRLMRAPPHPSEGEMPPDEPVRAGGLLPAPILVRGGGHGTAQRDSGP
jgi:cytochrome d ubiquinol oxidase subunit I